jgi:hypothetical protein
MLSRETCRIGGAKDNMRVRDSPLVLMFVIVLNLQVKAYMAQLFVDNHAPDRGLPHRGQREGKLLASYWGGSSGWRTLYICGRPVPGCSLPVSLRRSTGVFCAWLLLLVDINKARPIMA